MDRNVISNHIAFRINRHSMSVQDTIAYSSQQLSLKKELKVHYKRRGLAYEQAGAFQLATNDLQWHVKQSDREGVTRD